MRFNGTIFVEGEADVKFISDFVLTRFNYTLKKGTEIQEVKGKDSLHKFQVNFKQASGVSTNLLIFDANGSYEKRLEELNSKKNELDIEFEVFLFPNDNDIGDLEALLEHIAGDVYRPVLGCFDSFQECLSNIREKRIRIPDKKDKICIYSSLLSSNEAAKESNRNYQDGDIWNLQSDYLAPLVAFLAPYFIDDGD